MPPEDDAGNNVQDPTDDNTNNGGGAGPSDDQPTQEELNKALEQVTALQQDLKAAQEDATLYKKRFSGLQGTYQRDKAKWHTADDTIKEFEERAGLWEDERSKLTARVEELETSQVELDVTKASLERLQIIATEFPALLSLESDGLLPDAVGDDLREKLESMSEHLVKTGKKAIEQNLEGSVPRIKGEDPSTIEELERARVAAFKKGDMEEYDRLSNEYYQQKDA